MVFRIGWISMGGQLSCVIGRKAGEYNRVCGAGPSPTCHIATPRCAPRGTGADLTVSIGLPLIVRRRPAGPTSFESALLEIATPNAKRHCKPWPAMPFCMYYSVSTKVICFINVLNGMKPGILPKSGSPLQEVLKTTKVQIGDFSGLLPVVLTSISCMPTDSDDMCRFQTPCWSVCTLATFTLKL
jgi:hypothetical protein